MQEGFDPHKIEGKDNEIDGIIRPQDLEEFTGQDKIISNLRIYLSGENLATITRMTKLFDPETIGSNDQGNVYPLTRTYSVGLSVTF